MIGLCNSFLRAARGSLRALRSVIPIVLSLALPAPAAPPDPLPPDGVLLEQASYLERFQGDPDGAEAIYRSILSRGGRGEARAEALFRLGALLVRRGAPEGRTLFNALLDEFPERRDLAARADVVLVPRGERGASAAGPLGRVVARRTDGLFAFTLGTRHGLETGRRCTVLRAGEPVGAGLVLRLTDTLAAAKLEAGDVAPGDDVEARARPRETTGTAVLDEEGPLAARATGFLDAVAAGLAARAASLGEALASGATATALASLEVQVLSVDAAALGSLGIAFERVRSPRPEREGLLPDDAALVASLDAEQARGLFARVLRSGAGGTIRVVRTERVALTLGRRESTAFATRPLLGPAPSSVATAGFEGLRVTLEPRAVAPNAGLELEAEVLAVDRPPEPTRFPGKDGPIALAGPRAQRLRAAVTLGRERPAVMLAGLRDPFAAADGGRPAQADRQLLVLLHLSR